MWLRDFLPLHARFRRSRIMTFGYSSLIGDENNVAGMSEWAHSLLTALATARKSEEVRHTQKGRDKNTYLRDPCSVR